MSSKPLPRRADPKDADPMTTRDAADAPEVASPAGRSRRNTALIFAATLAFTLSLAGSALKNTIQVDFSPIAVDLGVSRGTFAWSTTVFAVVIAVASPVVGVLADRFGGAAVLVSGTVLAGAAFLICAAAPGVSLFASVYGVLGAFAFTMLSYVPLGKLASELFTARGEGLAYAVMTNGPAVGFIVLVPLWVWLGAFASWRAVFVVAGLSMLLVLTPLALLLYRLSGQDEPAPTATPGTPGTADDARLGFGDRLRLAAANPVFLALTVAFTGCGITMAFVDVHLVTDLHEHGMSPGVVSGTLAMLGVFEILGSLAAGRRCDRGRVRQTLLVGYALRGGAMVLVAFDATVTASLAFGVIFGASYLATVVATTLWIGRVLPEGARATGLGLLWTLHSIGAALSSQLGALVADSYNSYTQVAMGEALLVGVSFLLIARLPAPRPAAVPAGASRQ
ncbi:hypothetical protein CcI156_12880 [Frankia sp. CcI156]|nr:hypothetical protein Manayef4_17275 [Frankia sp. CgIM4]ONH25594.1 hypothetical protein CcI156_12880 [Frankia sp. CcI156]